MTGQITWSELISQPDSWDHLLARLDAGRDVPPVSLDAYDEIMLIGSGTSYYLALAVADWVARRYTIDVRAVASCEIMLDPHQAKLSPGRKRLVIAISRSGESSELLLAVRILQSADTSILGISCNAHSSLLTMADRAFLIAEGHEDGLVMLRSFTSMLLALQYQFGAEADRVALRRLPVAGRALIGDYTERLRAIAHSHPFDRFVYLASGSSYPIALEASLKVQEMSISTSETYYSLEYRHGPKAVADTSTLLVLFALSDTSLGVSLARDMKALGVTLLVVGPDAGGF